MSQMKDLANDERRASVQANWRCAMRRTICATMFFSLVLLVSCSSTLEEISNDVTPPSPTYTLTIDHAEKTTDPSGTPLPDIEVTPPIISEDIIKDAGSLITMSPIGDEFIRHVDLETGNSTEISFSDDVYYQVLDYYDECSMIMRFGNKITKTNLSGEIDSELFSIAHSESEFLYKVAISPKKTSVAYTLGQGYFGYDRFEIQDVYIMDRDGEIYKVTQNGGGWIGEWSHDERKLAYSDFDENGNQQLYIFDRNNNKRQQITAFQEKVDEIRRIRWSGDDQQILLEIYEEKSLNKLVVAESNASQPGIKEISGFSEISGFWWTDNQEIILQAKTEGESSERGLFLVDVASNTIIHKVLESQYSDQPFILATPLISPKLVGFFLVNSFFVYDFDSKEMHKYVNVQKGMNFGEWIPSPFLESSLNYCEGISN